MSDSRSSGERTGKKPKPSVTQVPSGLRVRGRTWNVSGSAWKGAPKSVIAAYAKTRLRPSGVPK